MNDFSIYPVDRSRSQSVEPLGSKPKFWFRDEDRRLLFNAEDRGTGEDWAEQCELDRLMQADAVEKAKIEARRKGHTATEQSLTDGSIKLTIHAAEAV